MSLIEIIATIFSMRDKEVKSTQDFTKYKIVTSTQAYRGAIIHQTDMVIFFRNEKSKAIKILKSNISHISIIKSETSEGVVNKRIKT